VAVAISTPSASSPERGSVSSGAAGRTVPCTTSPAITPRRRSLPRDAVRVDTGCLISQRGPPPRSEHSRQPSLLVGRFERRLRRRNPVRGGGIGRGRSPPPSPHDSHRLRRR